MVIAFAFDHAQTLVSHACNAVNVAIVGSAALIVMVNGKRKQIQTLVEVRN